MNDPLAGVLSNPGPHTLDDLHARLPAFSREAIGAALEALTAQGVLLREGEGPGATYRYAAPERYVQANQDVIRNPGQRGRTTTPSRGEDSPHS